MTNCHSPRRLALAALLGLSALLPAASATAGEPIPYRVLAQGTKSGIGLREFEVIYDYSSLSRLWYAHAPSDDPELAQPRPELDFHRERALALFLGERKSDGFRLDPIAVELEHSKIAVHFSLTRPGCAPAEHTPTRPFLMISLPRYPDKVELRPKVIDIQPCPKPPPPDTASGNGGEEAGQEQPPSS